MIQADDISHEFFELLSQAGWSPDRRVETAGWVTRLESEGFKSNPTVLALLESVGGLSIRFPLLNTSTYERGIWFEPVQAATGEYDRVEEWRNEIDVDLFPLGEIIGGYIVWAGNDGKFYYGHEFGLYRLGESFAIAMDQLAFQKSPLLLCVE